MTQFKTGSRLFNNKKAIKIKSIYTGWIYCHIVHSWTSGLISNSFSHLGSTSFNLTFSHQSTIVSVSQNIITMLTFYFNDISLYRI